MLKRKGFLISITVLVLLVVLVATSCTSTVPTGYTGIVTTFGRVEDSTMEAGFHLKTPFQKIILMDNREQRATFETQAFSSDIQQVDISGSINYSINKSTAMTLFKEVGEAYYRTLVLPRMLETTKAIFSSYTAENLIANRSVLSTNIRDELSKEMMVYGINIISVSIENIDFTDSFTDAVEAKQVAAQRKLQAEIEQEQATMEAEQAAERKRIAAEAEAEVQKINADAAAYSVHVQAEAEAEANKKIADSLTSDLIQYQELEKWNGELPSFYSSGEGTVLPILNLMGEE